MKTRILTGCAMFMVLLPCLIFSDTIAFPILLTLCTWQSVFEMLRCRAKEKNLFFAVPAYLYATMPLLFFFLSDTGSVKKILLVVPLAVLLFFLAVTTFSHGKVKSSEMFSVFATTFYIVTGFSSVAYLRYFTIGGEFTYLLVFLSAWLTDIFAYFSGYLFGRHKLIPDVSPKKTVEGSIGGTLMATILVAVFGVIVERLGNYSVNLVILTIAGFVSSLISQVGDLCMSVIKRETGIKDYGKIFPGHGGMLDRFDSILAVSVALFLFSCFFSFFEVI